MAAASNTNNNDLKEAKALLQELNMLKRKLSETPFAFTDVELLKQFKDLPGYIDKARRQLEGMEDSMSGLYGSLRGITSEFKGQATALSKVRGAFRQLEDAAQDLKFDEQQINDLNASQLKKLEQKVKKNSEILGQEARRLVSDKNLKKVLDEEIEQYKSLLGPTESLSDFASAQIDKIIGLTNEERALLKLYYDQGTALDEINDKLQQRIRQEKKVNDLLGVGGAAIQGISSFMSGLGMSSGIFSDAVQEAEEAMRETAKEIEAGVRSGNKLTVLMAGLGPIMKGVGKAMLDPAVMIQKIVAGFFEVNKAAVDYQRLTGINATNQAALNSRFASSVDYLTTAAELTEQMGIGAESIFSKDDIAALAEAKNLLGLTAEQAGKLGINSKVAGKSIDQYKEGIVKSVNSYNGLNGTTLSHGLILQDVLNVSEDISMSLGGDAEKITQAATAARSLGLNLEKVNQIADQLLNFEDSISAELEAELMTGKELNLEKAREYALTNNLAGVSEELKKNGVSAAQYAKMNRLEQESLAKALGMSREDLGKMTQQQLLQAGASKEAQAAARGMTVEQLEAVSVQERMAKVLEKLAQAFAPIFEALVPIVELLSSALQPVGMLIGYMAKALSPFIKGLILVYTTYKAIQLVQKGMLGVQMAMNVQKMIEANRGLAQIGTNRVIAGLEKQSLIAKIAGNAQLLFQLIREQSIVGIKTWAKGLDEKSLVRKGIEATFDIAKAVREKGLIGLKALAAIYEESSLRKKVIMAALTAREWVMEKGKALWKSLQLTYELTILAIKEAGLAIGLRDLAASIGKAAMQVISSLASIPVVGWALGLAAAGTVVALGAKYMMKDGVIDTKKGPVMSGDFGTVQLDPNDKAMYGADGKIKVGTDLIGNNSNTRPQTISQAVAKSDNTSSEIKQMRQENKQLLTALLNKTGDVYMDTNKVGRSQVLGSYKSS